MSETQKKILTLIMATLLLEFSSFTKLKKIWQLAFIGEPSSQNEPLSPGPGNTCPPGYTYVPSLNQCIKFAEPAI